MFLSMSLAFFLARKFQGKKYAISIVTLIVFGSFFSTFGWITIHQRTDYTQRTVQWYKFHPIPLSFPFYALVFYDLTVIPLPIDLSKITYQINFLTFEITQFTTYYSSFTLRDASIYYSLFLSVNIVGALVGYWINISTTRKSARIQKNRSDQISTK